MNETFHVPTFDELDQLMAQYGDEVSPVEVHAMLVGFQCGGTLLTDEALATAMQDFFKIDVYMVPEFLMLLSQLNLGIESSLQEDNFAFTPMLPEDESFIGQMCLFSRWCESFINGFSGTCPEEEEFSDDLKDVLDDIMTFTRMREEVDLSETDEGSLVEIIEYTKVAILMLYTELVLIPFRDAEREAQKAEKKITPDKRMPPSDDVH